MQLKLSVHAWKRYWDVHAWSGVITSLLVYVMFVLGAVTLFYRPLTVWEEPILQRRAPELRSVQAPLQLAEPLPEELYYYLPKDDRGVPKLGYFLPGTTHWRMWWLDESLPRALPQREYAAAFIYDLHYLWHEATGYWLQYCAGILVFGFLLAIVSGVLIHLRNLGPQLWRFRPDSKRRVFFSDLHKVTGVFGLPFQLVYALTGTMMALAPVMFAISVSPVFGGDELRAVATAGALVEEPPPRDFGRAHTPLSLDRLVERAKQIEPRLTPESFVFRGYAHEHGTVDVRGPIQGQPFGDGLVRLRAADGALERVDTADREGAVGAVARYIHGLHTVEYGGLALRFLMFVLAAAGCVTILTGNAVWLARRGPSAGNTLLARLTAGVGGGTLVAVGALLMASRLAPLEWEGRTRLEEWVLAAAFFGCIGCGLLIENTRTTWCGTLGLAGVLLLVLPLAATSHSTAGLFGSGPGHAVVQSVEIAFLCAGAALLAIAAALVLHPRGMPQLQLKPLRQEPSWTPRTRS